jgi:ABC-type dipeptide/oligopeptide/nickel transport system permease component
MRKIMYASAKLRERLSQPIVLYIRRRLGISLIVLFGISLISFATVYLLPSDPVTSRFPDLGEQERREIRAAMGLDRPLPVQYGLYWQAVLRGDLGFSYNTGRPVTEDLRQRVPATLELMFYGALIALALGLPLGIVAAVYRNRPSDSIIRVITIGILSVPSFWVGVVAIYIFFYFLRWAPAPMGRLPLSISTPTAITGILTLDAILVGNWPLFMAALKQLALPAIVLGLSISAPIARITRAAMNESLQEDYIIFARAVGVPEREVIIRDAFRGASVTVLTLVAYILGASVGGAALVETVFAWPGMGRYAVDAVVTSDMAPINAVLLLVAVSIALTNLLVDLGYAFIDPRIRYGLIGEQT